MLYMDKFMQLHKKGKVDNTTMIKMAVFKEKVQKMVQEMTKEGYSKGQILAGAGLGALISAASGTAETMLEGYLSDKSKQETEEKANEVFEKIYKRSDKINKYPKEKAREFFRSIYHFSPHIATDPLAAESYLQNALYWSASGDEITDFPINNVKEMTEIEDRALKAQDSRFGGAGGRASMLVEPIRKALSSEPKNLYTSFLSADNKNDYSEYLSDPNFYPKDKESDD